MLYRKIEKTITDYLKSNPNKTLVINGARQIGKSYIIRHVGNKLFENYIEINLLEDFLGNKNFENVSTVKDFYLQVSIIAGNKMKDKSNTLIFLDEIQTYPKLLTLLKFLNIDNKFTYIASGSLLGITLANTSSIPMGSISIIQMYPLDFEEFLIANNVSEYFLNELKEKFLHNESLDEQTHNMMMDFFKKYLLIGGLPEAINTYLNEYNIVSVRNIQTEIHSFYSADASKYDYENKLKIKRIYEMIPSTLENKKKRLIIKDIENIKGKTYSNYQKEFDYLINAGIALDVKAISIPTFPLLESSGKNLIKLYLNDVGILTNILYKTNINAILNNEKSINLGSVYESVVASELKAHGHKLFYYDNKNNGEVDYLIDDYNSLSAIPIEIKSGKDYTIHSALNRFISNVDYNIKKAYVLSNNKEVSIKNKITYLPIYYIMFF